MHRNTYFIIVGTVLGIVSLVHLYRAIESVSIIVGSTGWAIPVWPSWIAFLVAGYLSYVSFKFASGK
jgi:ABC-type dipeptide/oligopeptide/nickel transport system permease component